MASTLPGAWLLAGPVLSAGGAGAATPPAGLTDVPRRRLTGVG
jgi:hypothetical protein